VDCACALDPPKVTAVSPAASIAADIVFTRIVFSVLLVSGIKATNTFLTRLVPHVFVMC
jgi:hypothetical protein